MKVKLTKTAVIGGKRVRVVRLREPTLADISSFAEISDAHADDMNRAFAAMIARASGLDAEDVLGLPVDDVLALMTALGDLTAAVADRVEAAVARTSVPRSGLH